MRIMLARKPMRVALRHIKPEEANVLARGIDIANGSAYDDCRLILSNLADLPKVRAVAIAADEREANRVADETSLKVTDN